MKPLTSKQLSWSIVEVEHMNLTIAALPDGICFVQPYEASMTSLLHWVTAKCPDYELMRDDRLLRPYALQLQEYMQGRRPQFHLPQIHIGTEFQQSVWKALQNIPYGATQTYADIAASIGKPQALRAVGAAIGANPLLIVVPCHRVIGKSGALTGYRGGLGMKRKLLALEKQHLDMHTGMKADA
mgnify:CR=1 FL=1